MPESAAGAAAVNGRTVKTSETVALAIVHDIVAGGLGAGDKLPLESEMLQQYKVSRASLREALRLLEVQGLISIRPGPGGGPVVGAVEARNLARTASLYFHLGGMRYADIFATQELLEPVCAELAARHPERVARMAPFVDPAGQPRRGTAYHRGTVDFHTSVYALTGNGVLSLLTRAVTHIISSHIVSTMDPVELHEAIVDEHVEIARAISAGRDRRAHRLTLEHFQAQHDYYKRNWPGRFDEIIEWR